MGVFEEFNTKESNIMSTSSLSTLGYNIASSKALLHSYIINNTAGTTRYLKIYNISGVVNMGTDVPFLRHSIPTATSLMFTPRVPIPFSTGITVCAVSGPKDDGVGAVTAGDVHGFFMYSKNI